jgi:hypothetical protein
MGQPPRRRRFGFSQAREIGYVRAYQKSNKRIAAKVRIERASAPCWRVLTSGALRRSPLPRGEQWQLKAKKSVS